MSWVSLCEFSELLEDQGRLAAIDGYEIAVYLHAGKVFAMDNVCPHQGGPIVEGTIEGDCVTCPWHGWSFKLENGQMPGSPGVDIRTYPTRILKRDGQKDLVQADLPTP
jgi:sulfoxide reductase heme-binding subunit YedZ